MTPAPGETPSDDVVVRASGTTAALRWLALPGGAIAMAATAAAGDRLIPVVAAAAVVLVFWSAVEPDGHVPLLAVLCLGVQWVVVVDDPVTPFAVLAAAGIAVVHVAAAAGGVAPSAARWTAAMRRRWLRRSLLVAPAGAVTWLVVWLLDGADVPASSALVGAALAALAIALLASRGAPSAATSTSGQRRRGAQRNP